MQWDFSEIVQLGLGFGQNIGCQGMGFGENLGWEIGLKPFSPLQDPLENSGDLLDLFYWFEKLSYSVHCTFCAENCLKHF